MFGITSKDMIEAVIGQEIVQIGIGRHQISIVLETQDFILVESIGDFYSKNRDVFIWQDCDLPILDKVISAKVLDIIIISKYEIHLVLSSEMKLILYDDDVYHERVTFGLGLG